METLYSKLYDKYSKLKVKKDTEIENVSRDQEVKFVNYVSAADEFIEHLKKENEELHTQVNELRNEVASISSSKDEQYVEYQKLLFEENQKSNALSEVIERLQKFHTLETHNIAIKDSVIMEQPERPGISGVESDTSNGSTVQRTRKRSRLNLTSSASAQVKEREIDSLKRTAPSQTALEMNLADCSRKRSCVSSGHCVFQNLAQYLAGMEFCTVDQTDGICISATHLSSGYSFSLTWIDETDGEKVELLYQVLSLGTLERIAPEWMREVIIFSTRMCPIFFERLSRVIKLH
ncbi:uncharacterized protein LOC124921423 [Impatiens glandulifera]|uniref:uncharacterized protein LOC124921423 n=1 Tax=Impatiens glandulifera TaxID=253017 RepID=UPI001FB19B70|nr:uncharacterized protein LOC124921423 [Impatiens glandulifera]